MKKSILLVAVGVLLGINAAYAQAQLPPETPSLNRKVRNLGMGNTGVAITGTGDSSPFYNPAGLDDVEEGRFQFLSFTLDTAKSSTGFVGDIKDLQDDLDNAQTDSEDVAALDSFIADHTGKFEHLRVTMDIFNYARHNFAAGLVIDEKLDASFRDQSFPHFDMRNFGDATIYVAGSHGFFDKLLQVGVTLKPTIRFALDEVDQQVTYSDVVSKNANGDSVLEDQIQRIKHARFGMGVDVGMKSNLNFPVIKDWSAWKYLRPEVGFTWQDAGSPSFGEAEKNPENMSVGMAVHPDFWILKNTFAIDVRELNFERDFMSKFHLGAESEMRWEKLAFALRAGMKQGYFTAGFTADLWLFKLDGAVFSEEVGVVSKQHGNQRYAVNISFNI